MIINEVVPANSSGIKDQFGEYSDWVELYNNGNQTFNLGEYFFSDKLSDLKKWKFPDVNISPDSFVIIWLSGKNEIINNEIHTNFKLKVSKESLYLSNGIGIIDSLPAIYCPSNYSYGRLLENLSTWVLFNQPTPGAKNSTQGKLIVNKQVISNKNSGFYKSAININLSSSESGTIRYTTDGSEPSENSPEYINSILINKTTVLKARIFKNSYLPGPILVSTYFIGYNSQLPVISLSTHPNNLFDDDIGIYVKGNGTATGGYESNPIGEPANYWEDWEVPVTIEFFENDGIRRFCTNAGVKMVGKVSRLLPQKSFGVFFRREYGNKELEYPVFQNITIKKFKSLVFRNGGTENTSNGGVQFRDGLCSILSENIPVEKQAYRPAVMFINGEYWGIYEIREKVNKDFLASHFEDDNNNISILDDYHTLYPLVVEGDATDFNSMIDYMQSRNLSNDNYNKYVDNIMEINNFLDYMAIQIIQANQDGPGHNCKFWRYNIEGARYRWIMYDVDHSFGYKLFVASEDGNAYSDNTIAYYTEENGPSWPNPPESTFLLRHILENYQNKFSFINKLSDYLNTYYEPARVVSVIDSLADVLRDEMPLHLERWSGSISSWEATVEKIRVFAQERPDYLRTYISKELNAGEQVKINLDVENRNSGIIQINNLIIKEFPWSGIYYSNTPIQIKALPMADYEFVSWNNQDIENKQDMQVYPKSFMKITASFSKQQNIDNQIIITEINNYSAFNCNTGDWIELYNPNNQTIDLTNWILKDNDLAYSYKFPENTYIYPQSHFVISSEKMKFKYLHPQLSQWQGGYLDFGLDKESDNIILIDNTGKQIDSVSYSNTEPWPINLNNCSILGLTDYTADNSSGKYWQYYAFPGTPGQLNSTGIFSKKNEPKTNNEAQSITVFPNPAQRIFYIKANSFNFAKSPEIKMYNINGQIVNYYLTKIISENIIQIEINKQGLYFIELLQSGKRYKSKVAVTKN